MLMSRGNQRRSSVGGPSRSKKEKKVPTKEDFIKKRDFTGALALLEFQRRNGDNIESEEDEIELLMWIGYCAFHLGKYERAQEVYTELMSGNLGKCPPEVPLHLACVYYYMQMYKEVRFEGFKKLKRESRRSLMVGARVGVPVVSCCSPSLTLTKPSPQPSSLTAGLRDCQ
jgi:hypothetical protein